MAAPSDAPPSTPRYFTIGQSAERLNVSEKTIRRLIERGELAAYRFGRSLRIRDTDLLIYEKLSRL